MKQTIITRQQYLNGDNTHSEYYAQFVNDSVKARVLSTIGLKAIKASTDKHMNDIPLKRWDSIMLTSDTADQLKECGDYLTLSGIVCIAKEAARQIKEAS